MPIRTSAPSMERGRIVIVNLAKSKIGETAAHLMGALLLARVLAKMTTGQAQDFHLLIDEAHNFSSLALLFQEARKFRVSVTAVTQYLEALDVPTRAALIGTARTHAYFRLGSEDAGVIFHSISTMQRKRVPTHSVSIWWPQSLTQNFGISVASPSSSLTVRRTASPP
jgi:hypothetical protein